MTASDQSITVTIEIFPHWRGPKTIMSVPEGMLLDDLLESIQVAADTEAIMVNGTYVKPDYRLQHGDRVMVIPFMSGG